MGRFKRKEYSHSFNGTVLDVCVRDETRRVLYRNSFNIKDKGSVVSFLTMLEKFGGLSIYEIVQWKTKMGEWW